MIFTVKWLVQRDEQAYAASGFPEGVVAWAIEEYLDAVNAMALARDVSTEVNEPRLLPNKDLHPL